ncbi:hypothetical protein OE88DRAFT_1628739 [Heliocybe sulcata]|uniref:AB hydrolase-1 domain-containing protein n=1 Tax=Heliocybe sulcata TaxID=5364 RepID=A0A5C3N332_9AGAM|nr:hypothetical protein OE88DRAFT_1628739 [Heliocybe sulcata]
MTLKSLTLVADASETRFSYTDSGIPPQSSSYTTIIAIHGMGFTSAIFKRVQALSGQQNVRFVAVNRRGYGGSTPVLESESAILFSGTDDEKASYLNARGLEFAKFIDAFIQQHNPLPISHDGKSGGIALLGWSAGNGLATAAIANVDQLPEGAQKRLGAYIRAYIMQEPPSIAFGLPLPPQLWSPHMDTTIPVELQTPFYTRWITSYFDHRDITSRDPSTLSHILPSARRAPTIYSMSSEDIAEMVDEGPQEMPVMFTTMAQANGIYTKACFDTEIRRMLPKMKVSLLCGDATCSYSITGMWSIEDDDKKNGGGFVHVKSIPGANHFMHWDEPEVSLTAYMEASVV